MKSLYIFDMDGTLSLIDHRTHIINETSSDKWDRFYKLCENDTPNIPILEIMETLQVNHEIWVFTGRRESERQLTIDWLDKYSSLGALFKYYPNKLVMRSNGDYTKDWLLKEQWLNSMLDIDKNRLKAVFEDRQQVVDMWRNAGITCLQVAPGKF